MKLQLVIGNKNYSSWSMRPWVLLRQAGVPFEEVQLKFSESDGGLTVPGIEKNGANGKGIDHATDAYGDQLFGIFMAASHIQ